MANLSKMGWNRAKLGYMAEEVRDLFEPIGSEEHPYVGLEHIEKHSLKLNSVGRSLDTVSTKKMFKKGDILFGTLRPYFRKVTRVDFDGVCSTDITVIKAREGIDTQFLFYFIANQGFIDHATNISIGTRMPRVNWKVLCESEWYFPPQTIQKVIGAILSAYDDLIENNLRRIKILEEMAQALYREWFVHFRFPGHGKVRLVDSPLGKIPEGWEVSTLGDNITALESGKRPKGGVANITEGIPSIGAENVDGIGKHDFSREKYVPEAFYGAIKKGVVADGDVALYKDGAYIGRSTYYRDGFPYQECCVNEHVFLIRTDRQKITPNMLYLWFRQPETISLIRSKNANAAQPGINQKDVKGLEITVPDINTVQMFDSLVDPILGEIILLAKKNNVLMHIRDHLLPKLISGELDVSDLEIAISEEA